jgi:DNA-binding PadR family transcriptional regulator
MSLEHAILGFLNYKPFSGYDLKKVFDSSVQHFWTADQSQIYRTLTRLTEKAWVEAEKIEQENRPARKEYHITETGREVLQEWLLTPLPVRGSRSASLIQVFFAGQLSDGEILEMFERIADLMRVGLATLEALPQDIEAYKDSVQSPREFYCWMLTLDFGINNARANVVWVEEVIERIRSGELPAA